MLPFQVRPRRRFEKARDHIASDDTTHVAGILKEFPTEERALLVNYVEQRTTPEIVQQMNFDLAGLKQRSRLSRAARLLRRLDRRVG